jgi:hypothetical protein
VYGFVGFCIHCVWVCGFLYTLCMGLWVFVYTVYMFIFTVGINFSRNFSSENRFPEIKHSHDIRHVTKTMGK